MKKDMLNKETKKKLEKQQYRVIGGHSAVKICGWTKNAIRGIGYCYKMKFYGIMSHQCLQMTSSISCANRCTFCWRDYKAPVSKNWKWKINSPKRIIEGSIKAQDKLLEGFNKGKNTVQKIFDQSKNVKHVALSLTGEPINYPKINELIKGFNKKGISTFLVTNAQYPEEIKKLEPVTQLYLSIDAPTKELLKKIDNPLYQDYWKRMNKSLEHTAEKKQRTAIRLTLMKGINMNHLKKYANLIKKSNVDFVEIKSYMWVGDSQKRHDFEHMPTSKEIMKFAKDILKFLPEYSLVSEHYESRVVMLAKNNLKIKGKWNTWIDFEKYDKLVNNPKTKNTFTTMDYLKPIPKHFVLKEGFKDKIKKIFSKRK